MYGALNKVWTFIEENRLIGGSELVLCAISGGVDSMVLMDMLSKFSAKAGFHLHIAHFDHLLRGDEGALDGELVKREATKRGLPFSSGKGDVQDYMRQSGLGLEEAARILRYRFLFRLKQRTGARKIATAHHADDQVETILMRLMRGTGLRGLAGIKAVDDRGLIRPFLVLRKLEILEYAQFHGLEYREDPTNSLSDNLRNFIRNDLLSSITKDQKEHLAENILSLAGSVSEVVEYLESTVRELYESSLLFSDEKEISLDLKKWRDYHYFLRRELLRYSYKKISGSGKELPRKASDIFTRFCERAQSGKVVQLPGGITACKNFDTVSLTNSREAASEPRPVSVLLEPGLDTILSIGKSLYRVTVRQQDVVDWATIVENVQVGGGRHLGYFDREKLFFPLKLRSWTKGDRINPFGFTGTKKVSDLLQEAKVPRYKRESVPILTDADRILWVVGVRRSSHAAVEPATQHTLVIEIQKED